KALGPASFRSRRLRGRDFGGDAAVQLLAQRTAHRQPQDEATPLVRPAFDEDVATVLAQNLAADRQPDARSPGSLGAGERPEDVLELLRRDAGAVVPHADAPPRPVALQAGPHAHARAGTVLDGVDGVADDVQQRVVDALAVGLDQRQRVELRLQADARLL